MPLFRGVGPLYPPGPVIPSHNYAIGVGCGSAAVGEVIEAEQFRLQIGGHLPYPGLGRTSVRVTGLKLLGISVVLTCDEGVCLNNVIRDRGFLQLALLAIADNASLLTLLGYAFRYLRLLCGGFDNFLLGRDCLGLGRGRSFPSARRHNSLSSFHTGANILLRSFGQCADILACRRLNDLVSQCCWGVVRRDLHAQFVRDFGEGLPFEPLHLLQSVTTGLDITQISSYLLRAGELRCFSFCRCAGGWDRLSRQGFAGCRSRSDRGRQTTPHLVCRCSDREAEHGIEHPPGLIKLGIVHLTGGIGIRESFGGLLWRDGVTGSRLILFLPLVLCHSLGTGKLFQNASRLAGLFRCQHTGRILHILRHLGIGPLEVIHKSLEDSTTTTLTTICGRCLAGSGIGLTGTERV